MKFLENFIKIVSKNDKIEQKMQKIANIPGNFISILMKISENFKLGAVQRHKNIVDRDKRFPTSIYLQKSASIQTRTSLYKLAQKFQK